MSTKNSKSEGELHEYDYRRVCWLKVSDNANDFKLEMRKKGEMATSEQLLNLVEAIAVTEPPPPMTKLTILNKIENGIMDDKAKCDLELALTSFIDRNNSVKTLSIANVKDPCVFDLLFKVALAKNTRMKELDIQSSLISAKSLTRLLQKTQTLRTLKLNDKTRLIVDSQNDEEEQNFFDAIVSTKTLRAIEIDAALDRDLVDLLIVGLAENNSMERLKLCNVRIRSGSLAHLICNDPRNLQYLEFHSIKFDKVDRSIQRRMKQAFQRNHTLRVLKLVDKIDPQIVDMVLEAATSSASRIQVQLEVQTIEIRQFDGRKAKMYGEALRYNSNVAQEMSLIQSNMDRSEAERNMKSIFSFIQSSTSLQNILIRHVNNIQVVDLFLTSISKESLTKLTLGNIDIPMDAFSKCLGNSPSLKTLAIHKSRLVQQSNSSFPSLEKAFINHESLEEIILSGFKFDDNICFSVFAKLLRSNQSVRLLRLRECQFNNEETSKALCDLFEESSANLTSLLIGSNVRFSHWYYCKSTVFSRIIRTNKLRELGINCSMNDVLMCSLLGPLKLIHGGDVSYLETLHLYNIPDMIVWNKLISYCIPYLSGLKRLKVSLWHKPMATRLCHAVKRNLCLQQVLIQTQSPTTTTTTTTTATAGQQLLTGDDAIERAQSRINMYCNRNQQMQKWIKNIHSFPIEQYGELIAKVLDYEYRRQILFKILISFETLGHC